MRVHTKTKAKIMLGEFYQPEAAAAAAVTAEVMAKKRPAGGDGRRGPL